MKKNRTMRVAVLMLALTLLTCCFVGSTFAKYTSSATGSSTATVAKWDIKAGVVDNELSIEGGNVAFNLFETINDTGNTSDETSVADQRIAPGTAGSFTISIKNDSEVDATYTVELEETNANNVPLQYSVDGTTWKDSIGELVMTDLTNVAIARGTSATKTVYWRWVFDENVSGETVHDGQTDATDTALGWAATNADAENPVPTVTIEATLIVTQVD